MAIYRYPLTEQDLTTLAQLAFENTVPNHPFEGVDELPESLTEAGEVVRDWLLQDFSITIEDGQAILTIETDETTDEDE